MFKLSRFYTLVVTILLLGAPAFSQNEMSLAQCIRIALDNNIGIKRQELQVDLAKDNLQTIRASRLPGVEGFYSHNLSSGKTVNYEDYSYINTKYQDGNLGLQGSLPLYSGFSGMYQMRAAKYNLLSEKDKQEEQKRSITIEVTAAYMQILLSEELLGVAATKLESTREQLRMNEGFFKVGRISRVEVIDMKSQVAQDNLAKIQAENDVRTAYLNLALILNLSDENSLRIKKPLSTNDSFSLEINNPDKINEYAQSNNPGISSAEFLVKSYQSQLDAMKSKYSVSVSLNGLVYSRYSELGVNPLNPTATYPYSDQISDNMYSRASVNLSVPILSQFQIRSKIRQAKIQTHDAQLQLDQKKLTVRQDILKAHTAAISARAKYEASAEAVASANESFNLAREKYKAGISSSVDFKVAQNQLLQAQSIQIQSKYELLVRSKILDLYLDKPITLE